MVAALVIWQSGRDKVLFRVPIFRLPFTASIAWLAVSMFFTILAPIAFSGRQVLHDRVLQLNHLLTGMEERMHRFLGDDIELKLELHPELDRLYTAPGLEHYRPEAVIAHPLGGLSLEQLIGPSSGDVVE
jgi:hypothetical protein